MSAGRVILTCFSCATVHRLDAEPGRRDECSKCRADLHCCKNCRHYDSKVYNECRETQAERVQEKDRSNICDIFAAGARVQEVSERDKARAAAERLFKK